MSEMVERVAQALAEKTMLVSKIEREDGTFSVMVLRSEAEMIARAAIEAMREPTQSMLRTGDKAADFDGEIVGYIYRKMIDEALK